MSHVGLGTILSFSGSHFSGIATLSINDDRTGLALVPCDNAPTVRALASAFEDVIAPGHCVNVKALQGKRIYYSTDEFGLLAHFTPEDEASPELVDLYEKSSEEGD